MNEFEYGGYHFVPVRQFNSTDGDFFEITRRLRSDRDLGFFADGSYNPAWVQKVNYSHEEFYGAANSRCDIFQCVENGKLYIPCDSELQEWIPERNISPPKNKGR